MSVKQFNLKYYVNEDRILFRFNTLDQSEFKLWLTRRVTQVILKSAATFFEKEYEKQAPSVESVISESQQPDKHARLNESFESGIQYPIGADAVLVMETKCEVIKANEQEIFSLDFVLPGGGNINIKLPVPVMKKVILMLEEATLQAKWG